MATITLNIPDAQVQRVLDALCGLHGYDPASGLTQGQFAKQMAAEWCKREVQRWEQQARQAAMEAAFPVVPPPDVT